MKHAFAIATLFLSMGLFGPVPALSQILTTPDIDNLCRSAPIVTYRTTIVYVDLSSIKKGNDEWGYTILKKLELGPRERLTVLGVDPTNFQVLEVFDSCYPTLSQAEMSQIREKRGVWEKLTMSDPESQQRDNLQTFDARLRNSLDKIIAEAAKYSPGKRRDVLGAIAVDKNRFTKREAYYRTILYTNGSIVDDFDVKLDEVHVADSLVKKYPTSFAGAEVWIFGATGDESGTTLESKQKTISHFFLSNGASVKSFALSLPKQGTSIYSGVSVLSGSFEGGGIKGSVKLAITTTNDQSAKAWLSFFVGTTVLYLPVDGNYSCSQAKCAFKGTALDNVPLLSSSPYFRKGDQINLAGNILEKMEGSLNADTSEIFNGGTPNDVAKYKLEFSKQ